MHKIVPSSEDLARVIFFPSNKKLCPTSNVTSFIGTALDNGISKMHAKKIIQIFIKV